MTHLSFEKTALIWTSVLIALLVFCPDASAQGLTSNVNALIDSGGLLKGAAVGGLLCFIGLKIVGAGERQL